MRVSSLAVRTCVVGLVASAIAGCSFTQTTQSKYVGSAPATQAGKLVWTGQKITVDNANGDVNVSVGVQTMVSATMTPFAFANDDDKTGADAALADVQATLTITEAADGIRVQCSQAVADHGSAVVAATGCDHLSVTIPSGSPAMPADLVATAHNGNIVVAGVVGGAVVHSDNGSSDATVQPTKGATVESSCGNGDASLTLPGTFAADKVLISLAAPHTLTSEFTDVTAATTSRGTAGAGALSVVLRSDLNGDLTLKMLKTM